MYTLHSWLGLAFTIIFGLQLVGGLFSFLFPLIPPNARTAILPYHRTSGIVILGAIGKNIFNGGLRSYFFVNKSEILIPEYVCQTSVDIKGTKVLFKLFKFFIEFNWIFVTPKDTFENNFRKN